MAVAFPPPLVPIAGASDREGRSRRNRHHWIAPSRGIIPIFLVLIIAAHRGFNIVPFQDGSSARAPEHARFSWRFVAPLSIRSLRAPCGAATQQIAPPTRAPAGRGPTDARHSRRARARSHHGRRAATETPQLQRLLFTEMEEQPRAARRVEDEARVLFL